MQIDTPALPVAHSEVAEHGPVLLGLDAEGWVYVGLTIFFLLAIFLAKAPKRITDALDQRIADTRRELDEAKALRTEAEALLAAAKATRAAAENDAAAILHGAEEEAAGLVAKAGKRRRHARRAARADGRGKDRRRRAQRRRRGPRTRRRRRPRPAAAALIADGHDAGADKVLVDQTIAGLAAARLN